MFSLEHIGGTLKDLGLRTLFQFLRSVKFHFFKLLKTGSLYLFIMPKRSASAGKRTFKRRAVAGAAGSHKRVVGHGREQYSVVPRHLPTTYSGGNTIIRNFRRFALDASLYGTGAGIVAINQATLAAPPWLNLTATTNDVASAATLGELGAACQFQFDNQVAFAKLVAMFNEYQIVKIDLNFSMDNAPSYTQGNGGLPNAIPSVYIAYDSNDSTLPGSQAAVAERGDCEYHQLSKPFTFSLYPKPAVQLYSGGLVPGFAAPNDNKDLWLDVTSSVATPMYGVKMWWRNFQYAAAAGIQVRIQPVFFIRMRMNR